MSSSGPLSSEATDTSGPSDGVEVNSLYPTHCHALTFRKVVSTPNKPQIAHLPLPYPVPPTKLIIKVHFAALNPVDTQLLNFPLMSYIPGEKAIGRDCAGTVIAVGSQVKQWKIGDEVIVLYGRSISAPGTLTDYFILDPHKTPTIVRKPGNLKWEEAAGLPLVTLTGFTVLEWLPPLEKSTVNMKAGTTSSPDEGSREGIKREVLIIGASGGVGIVTVQLAKLLHDCHVTAICSTRNSSYVLDKLHADKVIEYNNLPHEHPTLASYLLANKPSSGYYDLIIDCVGGVEVLNIYPQLLHKYGAYVTIVGPKTSRLATGGPVSLLAYPQQLLWYLKGVVFGPRYSCLLLNPRKDWLQKAVDLAAEGKLRVEIEQVINTEKPEQWENEEVGWGRAFKILDEGRSRGKVVIKISEPGEDQLP